MKHLPKVFIIILNYNKIPDTLECIDSVSKLRYPNYEIVVVDNCSKDDSAKMIIENYPGVILVENKENSGYTGGNNVGIQLGMKAGADYIWLLNNDTCVEKNSLNELVEVAESSPEIGLTSPIIFHFDEPEIIQFCACRLDWKNMTTVYSKDIEEVKTWQQKIPDRVCLVGTALLIKRKIIEKIGFLDERFFAYSEDIDLSIRSNRAKYRNVIAPNSKVFHKSPSYERRELIRSPHFYFYNVRNEYILWTKYLKPISKVSFMRKYFSFVQREANYCHHFNLPETCTNACYDGAWSAIRGEVGKLNRHTKIPPSLRKLLMWHPNFWVNLIEGNFSDLFTQIRERLIKPS